MRPDFDLKQLSFWFTLSIHLRKPPNRFIINVRYVIKRLVYKTLKTIAILNSLLLLTNTTVIRKPTI